MADREKIAGLLDGIDDRYIEQAASFAPAGASAASRNGRTGIRPAVIRRIAAAACLLLILGITGAIAIRTEAAEYGRAVEFFMANGLSTEGLTRSEVKAVYRDITTNSFTYGKTAQVIMKAVPGLEIEQKQPTPEQLAQVWDKNIWLRGSSRDGYIYTTKETYAYSEQAGSDVMAHCYLECRKEGELLWRQDFTEFYVLGQTHFAGVTLAWGNNEVMNSWTEQYAWAACIADDGRLLWKTRLEHGFTREDIAAVLDNGDGTWAVISRGDLKHVCLTVLDSGGKQTLFRSNEVGNYGVFGAARLGDGYIIQLGHMYPEYSEQVVKMDAGGTLGEAFSYEAEDIEYRITGMAEFGGKIFLSAYSFPKQSGGHGRRGEVNDILSMIFSREKWEIKSEELTLLLRDNYTAVLLLCDTSSGVPKTFYSVEGSLGGDIYVNGDGMLEWNVESITSSFFSPATSSFSIGGVCDVFRYTFSPSGSLISRQETGETVPYRR